MAVTRVTPDRGTPPSQWKVRTVANVGTDEEFVRQLLELHDILKGCTIPDAERERANNALLNIQLEGLLPAFLELRRIRESIGRELPDLDRMEPFEDLARKLWKSCKDLMQAAAKLMGFDVGFLYQKDARFEVGLKKLRKSNPGTPNEFDGFLRNTRASWQKELADFRNTVVEHPSADRSAYKKFYQPEFAERLFDAVWRTIVTVLAMLLSVHLPEQIFMVDQGSNDPNREWPNRFRFYLVGTKLQNSGS
jgi:hypothetical protein